MSPMPPGFVRCLIRAPWLVVYTCSLSLLLAGCQHEAEQPVVQPGADPNREIPVVAVTTAALEEWDESVHVHGTFLPTESAVLGTKVPGRVDEVFVDVGSVVETGQKLAQLDRTQLDLEVRHSEAMLEQARVVLAMKPGDTAASVVPENAPNVRQEKALLDQTLLDLQRATKLRAENAISAEEFDAKEAAHKVAQARYTGALTTVGERLAQLEVRSSDVARAKTDAAESVIIAPFPGIVQRRFVAPGSYLAVGDSVVSLVRVDKVRFQGAVPEKQAHLIRTGQPLQIHMRTRPESLTVKIDRLTPVIDPRSRALLFEADVPNENLEIRPGLFAEADITVESTTKSVVVPASAVVEFAGLEKVWRVINGETVETIIETGPRRDSRIVVLKGLQAGEVIVTEGSRAPNGKVQTTTSTTTAQLKQ